MNKLSRNNRGSFATSYRQRQRFGIRKLSLGVGSVLLGMSFLTSPVSAEEIQEDTSPSIVEVLEQDSQVTDEVQPEETSATSSVEETETVVEEISPVVEADPVVEPETAGQEEGEEEADKSEADVAVASTLRSVADDTETEETKVEEQVENKKDNRADAQLVAEEKKRAFSKVTSTWSVNPVADIKKEVNRQEDLGLTEYVVQWGDTLSTISKATQTSVKVLVELNEIKNPDLIYTGQTLVGVLHQTDAQQLYTLENEKRRAKNQAGGTWTANTQKQVEEEIARQEALGLEEYVIQWGDTLTVLAKATNSTVQTIAKENKIVNPNLIYTGNTLKGILSAKIIAETPVQLEEKTEPTDKQEPVLVDKEGVEAVERPEVVREEPTIEKPTKEEIEVEEPPKEDIAVEQPTETVQEPTQVPEVSEESVVDESGKEEAESEEPTVAEPTFVEEVETPAELPEVIEESTVEQPSKEEVELEEPSAEEPTIVEEVETPAELPEVIEEPAVDESGKEETSVEEPTVTEPVGEGTEKEPEVIIVQPEFSNEDFGDVEEPFRPEKIAVSGYAINIQGVLLEEQSFQLLQDGEVLDEVDSDYMGYLYVHLADQNQVYQIKGDDFLVNVSLNDQDEVNVENVIGEFSLGRLLGDEDDYSTLNSQVIYLDDSVYQTEEKTDAQVVLSDTVRAVVGDILIIPPATIAEESQAIKVEAISIKDGKSHITYSHPDFFDVYSEFVIRDEVIDLAEVSFIPAEGVTLVGEEVDGDTVFRSITLIDASGSSTESKSWNKSYANGKNTASFDFSIKGTASIHFILTSDFRKEGLGGSEISLDLSIDSKSKVNIDFDEQQVIKLGELPININGLATVTISLYAEFDAKGNLTIGHTHNTTFKKSLKFDQWTPYTEESFTNNIEPKLTAKGKTEVGPKIELALEPGVLIKEKLVKLTAKAYLGAEGDLSIAAPLKFDVTSSKGNDNVKAEADLDISGSGELYLGMEAKAGFPILKAAIDKFDLPNEDELSKYVELTLFNGKKTLWQSSIGTAEEEKKDNTEETTELPETSPAVPETTPTPALDPTPEEPVVTEPTTPTPTVPTRPANAESDFEWKDTVGGVEITRYLGTSPDLVVPATLGGKQVVAIGSGFNHNVHNDKVKLRSLVLPEGVQSIGDSAFYNNELRTVVLPSSLTRIKGYAFYRNQITVVEFPEGLIELGESAFNNNRLREITIPSGISVIEKSTFADNQLTKVNLPEGLTDIGNGAFASNYLFEVQFPSTLTDIGSYAFSSNRLRSLALPTELINIGAGAFQRNQLMGHLTIPEGVVSISSDMFSGAFADNNLRSVTLPSTLTTIEPYFLANNKLTEVIIPEGVTTVDMSSFKGNNNLKIFFPNSLTQIGMDLNGAYGGYENYIFSLPGHFEEELTDYQRTRYLKDITLQFRP